MDGENVKNGAAAPGVSRIVAAGGLWLFFCCSVFAVEPLGLPQTKKDPELKTAAVLTCYGMIDEGLYESIVRRSNEAIAMGADFVILDVQTYGGRVDFADEISKYLIHTLAQKVHTAAYVSTEAISAGAMISVSCQNIIMRKNTTIGCSAPIIMGDSEMGAAEREKSESFVRSTFSRAAQANGYPEAILRAMVSQELEIWQLKNLKTGQFEYFEKDYLPADPNAYDLAGKRLIDPAGELLTLTDQKALEYGVANAVVDDLDGALEYLSKRYEVPISEDAIAMETMWSEEMVRFLNSPVISGLLVMGILLGVYVELHTPGLGLPGLLALICLIVLVGSRYLSGLANWIEVAVLVIGIILLLLELLVIPGFGIPGFTGIICILGGLFALMVKNAPDELPWPQTVQAWELFASSALGILGGIAAFVAAAWLFSRFMPKMAFLSGLTLDPSGSAQMQTAKGETPGSKAGLRAGDQGRIETTLRPAGTARFSGRLYDVVCQAEFIEKGKAVEVVDISGNRIVVKEIQEKA